MFLIFFCYFQKYSLLNTQMATFTLIKHLFSLAYVTYWTGREFTLTVSLLLLNLHVALCYTVCL